MKLTFLLLPALLFWATPPSAQAQTKAYFLGHSLVNFDMPAMVKGLSQAAGKASQIQGSNATAPPAVAFEP